MMNRKKFVVNLLFLLYVVACPIAYAQVNNGKLIQQVVEDVKKDELLLDFVQGYCATYVTQTSNTININQIICNTNDVDEEALSKKLGMIMSTKGYVTYWVYNMESRHPGLLRYMAENSMLLALTVEIANSSISYSQALSASEIERLIGEVPTDINIYNVHANVKIINLLKDYFPSIETNYEVSRSFNGFVDKENTAGTLKLTAVNVEGNKYIRVFNMMYPHFA